MTEVNKDRQQQTANTLCFVISLYPTARLLHGLGDMSIRLLFQWASTIKIHLSVLV